MQSIHSLIKAKYPRMIEPPKGEGMRLINEADRCIKSALKRGRAAKMVLCDPNLIRTSSMDMMRPPVPLISVYHETGPFLGLFPSDIKIEYAGKEEARVSFASNAFDRQEFEIMNMALPIIEPFLSEIVPLRIPVSVKIDWTKEWMVPHEIYTYATLYHKLIIDEVKGLDLPAESVVCDPACGRGELAYRIGQEIPHLKFLLSDINEQAATLAKRLNPAAKVYMADAVDFSYSGYDSVSLFIFCGLLNEGVVDREAAEKILHNAIPRSKDHAFFIVTGRSVPIMKASDFKPFGFFPLLTTKWSNNTFVPFYLFLGPKKVAD